MNRIAVAELAGLNIMWRQLLIDGFEANPAWADDEYQVEPAQAIRAAESMQFVAGATLLSYPKLDSKHDRAAAFVRDRVNKTLAQLDANNVIDQVDASRTTIRGRGSPRSPRR